MVLYRQSVFAFSGVGMICLVLTDAWAKTYHYATDATATPNGFFVLTRALADDFRMEISTQPITPGLGDPADAEHLEDFVAEGGILILIHNSVADHETDNLDTRG